MHELAQNYHSSATNPTGMNEHQTKLTRAVELSHDMFLPLFFQGETLQQNNKQTNPRPPSKPKQPPTQCLATSTDPKLIGTLNTQKPPKHSEPKTARGLLGFHLLLASQYQSANPFRPARLGSGSLFGMKSWGANITTVSYQNVKQTLVALFTTWFQKRFNSQTRKKKNKKLTHHPIISDPKPNPPHMALRA